MGMNRRPSDEDLPLAPDQTQSFLAGSEAKEEKRSRIELKWIQRFWAGEQEICDGGGGRVVTWSGMWSNSLLNNHCLVLTCIVKCIKASFSVMSQESNDKPDAGKRGQQVARFHYVEQSAFSVLCEKTPAEWENWDPGSQVSTYPHYLSSSLSYLTYFRRA